MPDTTKPVISNFSPEPGTPINPNDVISFDITDDSGDFTRILIVAQFSRVKEVVHDGDEFSFVYQTNQSVVEEIEGGYHYEITRLGGWPAEVVFIPFAIDAAGNENE